jgi:hypothetical protein
MASGDLLAAGAGRESPVRGCLRADQRERDPVRVADYPGTVWRLGTKKHCDTLFVMKREGAR